LSLERFPDPRQVKILQFLAENCHGSASPVDGWSAVSVAQDAGIAYEDMAVLVGDLEDRGFLNRGLQDTGDPVGRIAITSIGRDLLDELELASEMAAEHRAARRRLWIWDMCKLVLAAFLGALFFFLSQLLLDWFRSTPQPPVP